MDYPALRRQELVRRLSEQGLEACLITNPVNVTYLTGFSGESSYLFVGHDRTLLVSDARFTQQLTEECPGLEVHVRPPGQTITQAVGEVLRLLGFRSVGVESLHLTLGEFETLKEKAPTVAWKPERDFVERLRLVKDATEIEQIRDAIAIAERAFQAFVALLRPEDSEKTLSDALEAYVRRCGGRCTSFPTIVAVGDRAALPHAPPTTRTVAEGEFLLVDWGASGPLYKCDLTRILIPHNNLASSQPRPRRLNNLRLEEVLTVVCRAQEEALRTIRPGVQAKAVDAAARTVIAEAGYGDYFGHGLGHGIGLQIHEGPAVRPGSETVLQAGMVFTVEPGIYLPGWGGVRIEDDVLVTPDGAEVLTRLPRHPAELDYP